MLTRAPPVAQVRGETATRAASSEVNLSLVAVLQHGTPARDIGKPISMRTCLRKSQKNGTARHPLTSTTGAICPRARLVVVSRFAPATTSALIPIA